MSSLTTQVVKYITHPKTICICMRRYFNILSMPSGSVLVCFSVCADMLKLICISTVSVYLDKAHQGSGLMDLFDFFTCSPIMSGFVEARCCLLIQPKSKHSSADGRWNIQIILPKYKFLQESIETTNHNYKSCFQTKSTEASTGKWWCHYQLLCVK